MAKSTVQFLREPKRSPQYSWSLIGFFLFLFKHMGILPHLSPVTNANSCNDILIGFPPKRNQISYFFLTLSLRTITYWPKLPENDGFSSRAINFPNGELRRNLTSSGSRASRMDSILLGLWYVLTLSPAGSSPRAKILSGRFNSVIWEDKNRVSSPYIHNQDPTNMYNKEHDGITLVDNERFSSLPSWWQRLRI